MIYIHPRVRSDRELFITNKREKEKQGFVWGNGQIKEVCIKRRDDNFIYTTVWEPALSVCHYPTTTAHSPFKLSQKSISF